MPATEEEANRLPERPPMEPGGEAELGRPLSDERYPHLSQEVEWGPVRGVFELWGRLPPSELIANVNLVPTSTDGWVILRMEGGRWEIPGGTLEPGEGVRAALERELREEAGARLLSFVPFGAWRCQSSDPEPYRQHLPHPWFFRAVGYGQVVLGRQPGNPIEGEQVAAAEAVPLEEAMRRFSAIGRDDLAELYALAAGIQRRDSERGDRAGGVSRPRSR